MAKVKLIPISGFPEWLPAQKLLESNFIKKITNIFESFGYTPIETAAVERDEILTSKGEINKQIYSIFRPNVETEAEKETGLSLHFDLTVPLARYVAQYNQQLSFPFKRYQIQKVWRGERAQQGRFREFYQCDIDIIGDSKLDLYADAEVAGIIYFTFKELNFGDFTIHFSNRKILLGIIEEFNVPEDKIQEVLQILDKVERSATGMEAIKSLIARRISKDDTIRSLFDCLLTLETTNKEKLSKLTQLKLNSEIYRQGVSEISEVYNYLINIGCEENNFNIDISIVRGLDYYTGSVFETFLSGHEKALGSICSGGRYEDLASHFIDKKFPGVGISIGLTRLLNYIFDKNIIEQKKSTSSHIMIAMMDRKYVSKYIEWQNIFRNKGYNCEIFIQNSSLKKQLKYANQKGINYVILFGEDEEEGHIVKMKDMRMNYEHSYVFSNAIELLSKDIKI